MSKERPTLVDQAIRWLKNQRWVVVLVIAGAAIAFLAKTTEEIDKILVTVGLRRDALSLTHESQRDQLSRELAHSAWKRLFWMRAYVARVARGSSKDEQDAAWMKHIEASEEWASQTMVFLEALDQFYGPSKASCFEGQIEHEFSDVGKVLADFRYSMPSEIPERQKQLEALNKAIDRLNNDLYLFVRGFRSSTDPRAQNSCD